MAIGTGVVLREPAEDAAARYCPSSLNVQKMNAFIKYSLSTEPHDAVTLLCFIVATCAARFFRFPETTKSYKLIMSHPKLWPPPTTPLTISSSHRVVKTLKPLASDAVSYALSSGYHDLALEWIDQSTSVVWGHVLHLRPSFTGVAVFNPNLAAELTKVTSELAQARIRNSSREHTYQSVFFLRWEKLINEARKLPGLDRLLQPKMFPEIQSLVDTLGGPVVYFTVSGTLCHALCVVPGLGEAIHIPLPGLTWQKAELVTAWFRNFIQCTGREEKSERVGKLVKKPNPQTPMQRTQSMNFKGVLAFLWDEVVKPVLNGLGIQRKAESARDLPRIRWCPSGSFASLPLHPAGHYDCPVGENIMDYVVSSYIPSASVISHITRPEMTPPNPSFLAIANPQGCGLFGTLEDLHVIRKRVVDMPLTELIGADATVDAVRKELTTASWVHFACHGVQDKDLPMESALILADHMHLTLEETIQLSLPKAQFAFLSACQAAKGDLLIGTEFAHLTAGMLVAGFRSVIGTMWKISDYYAPRFADRVYERLFEGNQPPDYRCAAFALHDAVQALRREENLPPEIWVPFIHAGA